MDCSELQEEEREVLLSIYEADECFSQVNNTTYTYKVGESGSPKSFLLQISWGDSYPSTGPDMSLDGFYNKHLNQQSKEAILSALAEEVEALLGSPMTYSLFEHVKEHGEGLVTVQATEERSEFPKASVQQQPVKVKKQKKEVLSKAAKRRLADRLNPDGELPRGWDWVDIIKHLSKTGSQTN